MKAPNLPPNEAERLAALASYDVLDTEADASFDGLTRLAAAILEVPIALVSLVDVDRQWFKSRYGLAATQTPREVSFCGHVVGDGAPLIVGDALGDSRFSDNPLVTGEPRVRFYAGVPLRNREGHVLGTLCVIDHVARAPTRRQLELLTLLSNQVVDQLEARRGKQELLRERAAALESARRLSVLFEAMAEGVVVQDQDGSITTANRASEQILGLSRDEASGRTSLDARWSCIHPDGTAFPGETHPAMVTLKTGKPCLGVVMGMHRPNHELRWISINSLPLRHADGEPPYAVITTFHDITPIKAAQDAAERLSRQERLVTTGTLAAGVGHEINNPLAFVLANLEFSLEELRAIAGGSPSGRLRELITALCEARDGAERIRKIVRGLRALAREETEPIPTDVASVVESSMNMAAHEIKHKATLVCALAQTPPVMADESRLSQILVNLLTNAAQSFPTGELSRNEIRVTSAMEGEDRVCISVSDNGPGIPAELQRRIFDPFFTTKPVGQGTGLGLSICQSIATTLGGELRLESTVGRGSSFQVILPVAKEPLGEEVAQGPRASPGPRGRILVIDDEPAILSSIRRILEKEHEVVALGDSREALRRLESGERFDVVFCDLMMPNLSGDELYQRVRMRDAQLADRFVFLTGGANNPKAQMFLSDVPNERLEKPFNTQNLRGIAGRFFGSSR